MTALAHAEPEQVLRAGALLGATAEQLGVAVAACRRSAAVRWVGRAQEGYQQRLDGLARDLVGVRSAFDAACDALLGYGQALARAVPLAQEADRLEALGDEALLARVPALRWEATQTELAAAARLVVALDELTARAPRTGAWTAAQHDAASFATGMADYVKGLGSTVASVVSSLPGVGSGASRSRARHELAAEAAEAAQPWKQVQDLVRALQDGLGFRAAGGAAMAVVLRRPGVRYGKTVRLFGTHDELTAAMLTVMRRGGAGVPLLDAWAAARVQAELVDAWARLKRLTLPSLDALLEQGVDLVHQEAKRGHTMIRHIGRDPDFLRRRQRELPGRHGPHAAGSFASLDEAERLVDEVLRAEAARLRAFVAGVPGVGGKDGELVLERGVAGPVGVLVDKWGRDAVADGVRVVVVRSGDAGIAVKTAFPVVMDS